MSKEDKIESCVEIYCPCGRRFYFDEDNETICPYCDRKFRVSVDLSMEGLVSEENKIEFYIEIYCPKPCYTRIFFGEHEKFKCPRCGREYEIDVKITKEGVGHE